MFCISSFIAVYVTLYIIYIMKNAIETEKAKNKEIISKLKAKNEDNASRWVTRVFRCIDLKKDLKDQYQIIDKLKSELLAEKAKNKEILSKLKAKDNASQWVVTHGVDLKKDLMKDQSQIINKLKSELIAEKTINQKIIDKLKSKLIAEKTINRKIEIDLENNKKTIIVKLKAVAELQLKIDNLLSDGVDKKDAVIKNLKLKIDMISKKCSVCMLNDVDIYLDPCGHTYCSSCLITSYNCSKCKSVMKINNIYI